MQIESPDPWPLLESRPGPGLVIFRVRTDLLRNPRTGVVMERLVLETPDWVNVVALTPERQLVLVRQFRSGVSDVTTEIPGGVIDPGESHRAAAERELRAGTSYTAPRWPQPGAVLPNPASPTPRCHHWLAEDAVLSHPIDPDPGEDLRVGTASLDEVKAAIARGEIAHSLVITALSRILDLRS